jgi:hypothetical protein
MDIKSDLLLRKMTNLSGFDRTSESATDGTDAQINRFRTELNIVCAATAALE